MMITFSELTKLNRRTRIIVEDKDYKLLLEYAKHQGYKWRDGRNINPNLDKPDKHTKTIVITDTMSIYQPCGWISHMALNGMPTYKFEDIKEDMKI